MPSLLQDINGFLTASARPLIVVLGPTASGKTSLSIQLAKAMQAQGRVVEIVNADSRQLYRHLSIGTAKITPEAMQGITHHLLDVLDPKEEVTAAWYKAEALRIIDEIHHRGNIPMLVGGSMLYISAVVDDLSFVAKPDTALRQSLSEAYDVDGGVSLFTKLQQLDPEGAASVDPRNKRYLVRALEVCMMTGKSLDSAKVRKVSPFDLFLLGVALPRAELHKRIAERTDAMFAQGWVEEVSQLLRNGYTAHDPGLMSHGYRQIAELLQHKSIAQVKADLSLRADIAAQARQFARRQMTWWRRDKRIRWVDPASEPLPAYQI